MATVLERAGFTTRTTPETTERFPISSHYPLPERAYGRGRTAIYPFVEMRVGDSFAVPATASKNGAQGVQSVLTNCSRSYAKKHNPRAKFATRTVDSGRAVRIWRIA